MLCNDNTILWGRKTGLLYYNTATQNSYIHTLEVLHGVLYLKMHSNQFQKKKKKKSEDKQDGTKMGEEGCDIVMDTADERERICSKGQR